MEVMNMQEFEIETLLNQSYWTGDLAIFGDEEELEVYCTGSYTTPRQATREEPAEYMELCDFEVYTIINGKIVYITNLIDEDGLEMLKIMHGEYADEQQSFSSYEVREA
jgi:hypothetical protein